MRHPVHCVVPYFFAFVVNRYFCLWIGLLWLRIVKATGCSYPLIFEWNPVVAGIWLGKCTIVRLKSVEFVFVNFLEKVSASYP